MNNALRALAKSIPEDYDVGALLLAAQKEQPSSKIDRAKAEAYDSLFVNLRRKASADHTLFEDYVDPPHPDLSEKN